MSPHPTKTLPDDGLSRLDALAEAARVHGHIAPAEHGEALAHDQFDEHVLTDDPIDLVLGKEGHADAVLPFGREVEAQPVGLGQEEGVRQLDEHARTVTGEGIGPHGSAVGEVGEDGLALLDDPMALSAPCIRDEADPAGIVVPCGVVEPISRILSSHGARQPKARSHTLRSPCGDVGSVATMEHSRRIG